MNDEADRIADAAARAEIACKEMRGTTEYLARGRIYRDTPSDELGRLWVESMREWARVIYPRPKAGNDTEAEFALRSEEPPWDEARPEFEMIVRAATASAAGMTDDEKQFHNEDMVRLYFAERDGQH